MRNRFHRTLPKKIPKLLGPGNAENGKREDEEELKIQKDISEPSQETQEDSKEFTEEPPSKENQADLPLNKPDMGDPTFTSEGKTSLIEKEPEPELASAPEPEPQQKPEPESASAPEPEPEQKPEPESASEPEPEQETLSFDEIGLFFLEEDFPTNLDGFYLYEKRGLILKMINKMGLNFGNFFNQRAEKEKELHSLNKTIDQIKIENQQLRNECQECRTNLEGLNELLEVKALLLENKGSVMSQILDLDKNIKAQVKIIEDLENKIKEDSENKKAMLQRISEIKKEIQNQRKNQKNLTRQLAQLSSEKQEAQNKLAVQKIEQDQMAKYAEELDEVREAILI